ncbi:MAG: efflux RND transporter periplasmic adaptor subunit [Steroidobacteraceae bacterium]
MTVCASASASVSPLIGSDSRRRVMRRRQPRAWRNALARRVFACAVFYSAISSATVHVIAGTAANAAIVSMSGTVIARVRPVVEHYRGYGQVRPVAVTNVNAVEAGTVTHLVLPGARVRAGQVLAILAGPQAEALLAQYRGALRAAAVRLAADHRELSARLVTRQRVAADQAAYTHARGQLQVALHTLTLRAPADGEVLAVDAADGEQLAAGQPVLTLQTGRPKLKAIYYGTDALAIRAGMTGEFRPVSGLPVPVRVLTVAGALGVDGGEQVWLAPRAAPGREARRMASWRSGQWGTVTLNGATRSMVALPSRALILDRAHWWVLVRTEHGNRRQQVVPGSSRGWTTFIARGVTPGEHVVVQNAYLEFFRGIARQYTPPN